MTFNDLSRQKRPYKILFNGKRDILWVKVISGTWEKEYWKKSILETKKLFTTWECGGSRMPRFLSLG